jgi:RNA-directed DNA polymerase
MWKVVKEGRLGNLETPPSVRKLQTALHAKAKAEPEYRFYLLYDKVYRADVLSFAYARCKANGGAAGVDGQTFDDIEAYGSQDRASEDRKSPDIETDWNPWLEELARELRDKTYRPQAVRRVFIPKPNSKKMRPLGIATIRDRVVQTAAMLVLEPIFEADLQPEQHAYRAGVSALDAVKAVHRLINTGYTDVVDADLRGYLDRVSYCTQIHEAWLKRSGREQLSLRRRPFLRPRLTWMASMSPRLTRCHTVCRETPSRRMVWYMVRYPSGASSATRLRKSSVRRMRQGAPGVSCSPAMMPSLSQR